MAKRKPGRPDVFTPQQNIALRAALRGLRVRGGLSQDRVGEIIGVSQQTASKLLDAGGFSYATATALAKALGHETVDAFFVAKKSLLAPDSSSTNTVTETAKAS